MISRQSALFGLVLLLAACAGSGAAGSSAESVGGETLPGEPWVATASSFQPEHTPDMAVDGDPTTRWSSTFNDKQWLQIDFRTEIEIKTLALAWEAAFTKQYDVLVSRDGKTWEKIYHTDNGAGNREVIPISKPVTARYLKLDLLTRATEWGNSLFEVYVNASGAPGKATASSGTDAYSPDKAVDGDGKSRWSSDFDDNQWWQLEFDEPRSLCGVTLNWETAFGEKYNLEITGPDGKKKIVYAQDEGDGNRDIIYFAPQPVKAIRLNGILRGTGWGYSLFEVALMSGNQPQKLTASDFQPGHEPALAMDGDKKTYWHSDKIAPAEIVVALPRQWDLGGLQLTWGADYAKSYSVEASSDNKSWKPVYDTVNGNGSTDWDYFQPTNARYLRIKCRESATGHGFALAEIELKGAEEKATPIKVYQALAKEAPAGHYPIWLTRQQEFWTVMGLPDDEQEALVSEIGSIEPCQNGFTVMPVIMKDGKLITFADAAVSQSLVDSYLPLPGVSWRHAAVTLDEQAVCYGSIGSAWSAMRYRVGNPTSEASKLSLVLAVLPVQINPVWQGGGLSAIKNLGFADEGKITSVKIDGKPRVFSLSPVSRRGAADMKAGGVMTLLGRGEVPANATATDPDGLTSGCLIYDLDLPAGGSQEIVVLYPMGNSVTVPEAAKVDAGQFFARTLEAESKRWRDLLGRFSIRIPEQRLIEIMKTNIAYILINKDGPWTKPGSRNYCHSWVRDGAMTCVVLLQMGIAEEVKQWLDALTPLIWDKGMVPYIIFQGGKPVGFNEGDHSGEGKEFDSQGEYVYAVRGYFDYTGDRGYLEKVYPKVIAAMHFQAELRKQRLTPEYMNDPAKKAYRGILPLSNSHEGYYPAMHSYWDDFWGLRGLKDALYLAQVLGKKDDAKWLAEELGSFRTAVAESIKTVIAERKINNIPGCVEKADCDPTSTSIAIMVSDDMDILPSAEMVAMYDRYFEEFTRGMDPKTPRTFTPYEARTAEAFVQMGRRDRALTMLRFFAQDSVRPFAWNHMAEVVHARLRAPSYIGDMPHTWVGSGYVSAIRTLFAYEESGRLVLAAGIPAEWYDKGASVSGLPTLYGKIGYSIRATTRGYEIDLTGAARPPAGVELWLPRDLAGATVLVGKTRQPAANGVVKLSSLPARVIVQK